MDRGEGGEPPLRTRSGTRFGSAADTASGVPLPSGKGRGRPRQQGKSEPEEVEGSESAALGRQYVSDAHLEQSGVAFSYYDVRTAGGVRSTGKTRSAAPQSLHSLSGKPSGLLVAHLLLFMQILWSFFQVLLWPSEPYAIRGHFT